MSIEVLNVGEKDPLIVKSTDDLLVDNGIVTTDDKLAALRNRSVLTLEILRSVVKAVRCTNRQVLSNSIMIFFAMLLVLCGFYLNYATQKEMLEMRADTQRIMDVVNAMAKQPVLTDNPLLAKKINAK